MLPAPESSASARGLRRTGANPFGWPLAARYALAVILPGLALLVRLQIGSALPFGTYPFLTFFPAVLVVAYVGGIGPGTAASVLSVLTAWLVLVEPRWSFALHSPGDTTALALFAMVLAINLLVLNAMHRAVARARAVRAELERSRGDALLQAAGAEAERRVLDATFEAVPAAIVVADSKGRLLRMNRAVGTLWGAAPHSSSVEGYGEWKGWWADGSARDGQPLQPHEWGLARALELGETCSDLVAIEPFHRPGERVFTLLSAAPVRGPDGGVIGGVVSQVDITARVRAEQALRESQAGLMAREAALRHADRQKDIFLATLAHELRNPLAPIRSASHLIGLRANGDGALQRAAGVIERQSAQLARLVEDLLDLSRVRAGNLPLQPGTVDLRQVVESALETCQPQIDAARHDCVVRLPAAPMLVSGDDTRLAQCVANLVHNAVKFTRGPGRITIEVGPASPGWAEVRVADNGEGIGSEMLPRLFELFVQERHSGMAGKSGLGIGLALTRHLVELHGGSLQARSEGPGKGAEFTIQLPLVEAAQPAPQAPGEPPAPPAVAHKPSVLVVDDNADAAALLQELFELEGYPAQVALDGLSALEAVRCGQPEVVVLDIGLPDISGFEVAQRLRADTTLRQPLLIALTGWGDVQARDQAHAVGIDHHLTKPAEFARVLQLIRDRRVARTP